MSELLRIDLVKSLILVYSSSYFSNIESFHFTVLQFLSLPFFLLKLDGTIFDDAVFVGTVFVAIAFVTSIVSSHVIAT